MPHPVKLTDAAAGDVGDIWEYIGKHDSQGAADHVLTRFEEAFSSLSEQPSRGTFPKELLELGLREYREIFFKPYRIIFRLQDDIVYVLAIADGRRDMRALLERRLLRV
ncbi:MAG: type II toxin-antitoxin system RelE/ParE family toxin [Gammaproteobacteria bacterium]|nr:type II toxin-antitoxin system RelE/ParE family toxin [Gammaproteobacteria bacterium]MDE0508879.1 type II toxin-antitoxin system RelE/ParE family toxin [Gammaproteobacteria bacterium]MYA66433.1 type II toxin-antitoxin system RelE/ParE family toxin [Gammaproteobacteria bacterium]MYH45789.1 type II toxin-antitoxin system RelE/ParE family toxin [Gammaproteobacteria bacterium]MYL12739.1 type II toxin-antitoxin system RelE/ParE family toxin [Gammaproteobacteria bacterium]